MLLPSTDECLLFVLGAITAITAKDWSENWPKQPNLHITKAHMIQNATKSSGINGSSKRNSAQLHLLMAGWATLRTPELVGSPGPRNHEKASEKAKHSEAVVEPIGRL